MAVKLRKAAAIWLLSLLLVQGFAVINLNKNVPVEQQNVMLIEETASPDELLPNIFKTTKRISEKITEYNSRNDEASSNLDKGNSAFYIYNSLIPRTLAYYKIHSDFFTVYFSTSV